MQRAVECLLRWVQAGEAGEVMHQFPRAALTNYYKLGDLKPQQFIVSWFWKSEVQIKVSAGWVHSGGSEEEPGPCSPLSSWRLLVISGILWLVAAPHVSVVMWLCSLWVNGPVSLFLFLRGR